MKRFTGGSFGGGGLEAISVRTRFSVVAVLGAVVVWVWHHLRMEDLRARLGMTTEKSGVLPSGS